MKPLSAANPMKRLPSSVRWLAIALLLGSASWGTSKALTSSTLTTSGNSLRRSSAFTANKQTSAATPEQVRVYAVSSTVLAVEVAAPTVIKGQQSTYVPQPGDTLVRDNGYTRVKRNSVVIGTLTEATNPSGERTFYPYDQVTQSALNLAAADLPRGYAISSAGDADYSQPTQPIDIFRKTKPVNMAEVTPTQRLWLAQSTLYLTLPKPIKPGETYQIRFSNLGLADTTYRYEPTKSLSEAVHVSQLGFRPDDPLKVGYLSTWMGNGGGLDYPEKLKFTLVDQHTQQPVFSSVATRVRSAAQTEDPRGRDYTLTEVHRLDFSAFNQPGEYRLCVAGIGCSLEFEMASSVWQKAFITATRGFYHQRSGIAITAPYSDFRRPRAFHPDDGVKVYQSGASLLDVDMGIGDRDTFKALTAEKTNDIVPNAWGGYFDAGDWDRRIQHLAVPRGLLELYNLFPDHFKTIQLNIPESTNDLPDVLDEALWSLDSFRRLQTADGGIRGGIESAEHPRYGETSWQESQTIMAYAPDVWSSYLYAGVAARAAFILKADDAALADTYQQSALLAMAYAEKHYPERTYTGELQHHVKDQRNLAALELYRLTQASKWHELFLATTVFQAADAEPFIYSRHEQRDAAFLYAGINGPLKLAGMPPLPIDARVQANARAALLRYADELVTLTNTTAFGWSKDHPESPVGWGNGLGAPRGINLLQAHALTQASKYLLAGISSAQFNAGANPDNLVLTTGMGDRSPQNPLIIDQRLTAQSPPPGITVYGPADLSLNQNYWGIEAIASSTFPPPTAWPTVETYFDIYLYPMSAEFTVDYMLLTAYTWGYLSAR